MYTHCRLIGNALQETQILAGESPENIEHRFSINTDVHFVRKIENPLELPAVQYRNRANAVGLEITDLIDFVLIVQHQGFPGLSRLARRALTKLEMLGSQLARVDVIESRLVDVSPSHSDFQLSRGSIEQHEIALLSAHRLHCIADSLSTKLSNVGNAGHLLVKLVKNLDVVQDPLILFILECRVDDGRGNRSQLLNKRILALGDLGPVPTLTERENPDHFTAFDQRAPEVRMECVEIVFFPSSDEPRLFLQVAH